MFKRVLDTPLITARYIRYLCQFNISVKENHFMRGIDVNHIKILSKSKHDMEEISLFGQYEDLFKGTV